MARTSRRKPASSSSQPKPPDAPRGQPPQEASAPVRPVFAFTAISEAEAELFVRLKTIVRQPRRALWNDVGDTTILNLPASTVVTEEVLELINENFKALTQNSEGNGGTLADLAHAITTILTAPSYPAFGQPVVKAA